jgi:hypothetical protein
MTPASAASQAWPRRRWWGLVVLVFVAQVLLIFLLGQTTPGPVRKAAPGLTLRLAGKGSAELLALRDPTLFVLPRPPGAARPAALRASRPEAPALAWPAPTTYPPPALDQPGAAFTRFVASNLFDPLRPPVTAQPRLSLPVLPPPPPQADRSSVRLEGGLAQRRLVTPLDLPSQTNRDILRDSVVRLLVGADGVPRSVALLSGSGSAGADQLALDQARGARFEPLDRNPVSPAPDPQVGLAQGRMIFLWHSVPLSATNAPSVSP